MINIIKEKWDDILELMKIEHDISEAAFNTWVKALYVHSVRGSKVYVTIKNELATGIDYVIKKYKIPLQVAMCEVLDCQLDVDIIAPDAIAEMVQDARETKPAPQAKANLINTNLNPRYTFDTFVVGKNNELAHATALAVAEDPGIYGNPLFIYGGVGLGKTHLMHSIAHYVLQRRSNARILYVTSEEFTNELITAIRTNRNEEFRNKYRNLDMLLIDDIQFIVGRESTQEEFFHTFNTLYAAKKQIVISSDKPPKDIENLEDRLISRFKVGLTVDIQPPNYETRMAILSKYAELDNININQECMHYVADNIKSNIRELEGALNQIHNLSRLKNRPIEMDLVREALENIITPDLAKPVTAESIINIVAEHFNISVTDITGHKRSKDIAYPRQICMYLCRHMTDSPLQSIGNALGKKDHTTIIHGIEKIEKSMDGDENLKNTIDILIKKINPSK